MILFLFCLSFIGNKRDTSYYFSALRIILVESFSNSAYDIIFVSNMDKKKKTSDFMIITSVSVYLIL